MAIPYAALGAGMVGAGVAGSLFGGKKIKTPDITAQLAQVKANTERGQNRVQDLYDQLQKPLGAYEADTTASIAGARERGATERSDFMQEQADLTEQTKAALRANLYSKQFGALPDTLRAVREAAAAGSGIDSGAYQQAVQNIGAQTSRAIAEGETELQAEGLRGQQTASQQAYQTFSALSSKLDDQELGMIAKVMDTKREDLVRRTAQQLGLDESETQAIIDLMNFQQSGQLAASSAESAQRQELYNALIGGGSSLLGRKAA